MTMQRQPAEREDEAIARDIRETLRWDMRIDHTKLDLAVAGGEVRLTGSVGTKAQRAAAVEDAARIKGVRAVVDQIVVPARLLRHDEDLAADVRETLRRDRRLDHRHIWVGARDGIVHLTGAVPTLAMKRAAAEDASYTAGIVDLANELRVVPSLQRLDAEIAADVRAALDLGDQIARPDRIAVEVQQGTVYLRGAVQCEIERHAAANAARLVAGATDLVDELAVEPS